VRSPASPVAAEERRVLRKTNDFVPHGLAPETVIAIVRASSWWRPERSDADARLAARVTAAAALPGEFFTVALGGHRWLRRRLDRIDGALIYGR
jgi:hypothetical protein